MNGYWLGVSEGTQHREEKEVSSLHLRSHKTSEPSNIVDVPNKIGDISLGMSLAYIAIIFSVKKISVPLTFY